MTTDKNGASRVMSDRGVVACPPWPFPESPTATAFAVPAVVAGRSPVLRVVHEADGTWLLLGDGDVVDEELVALHLVEAPALERTLVTLADLPRGWEARRTMQDATWSRSPSPRSPRPPATGT